jgi:hypothetical protein
MVNKHEASAGIPNTSRALSIPITSAESDTRAMNGYITRTISTISEISAGL